MRNDTGCDSEDTVRVVCLGETMLMFAPPRYELIEHCDRFRAYSGGSESNVAIGLERLGMHAGGDIAFGTFWYIAQRETFMLPLITASTYLIIRSEKRGWVLWPLFFLSMETK